jgi:hypothetical protein
VQQRGQHICVSANNRVHRPLKSQPFRFLSVFFSDLGVFCASVASLSLSSRSF